MSVQFPFPFAKREPYPGRRAVPRGRVLLVSPQPFYEDRGTPIAVELVSRTLASIGYEVDLLAFPIGEEVAIPGVTVHRSPRVFGIRTVPIGFSAGKLALDAGLFRSLDAMLHQRHYDVVHAVEEAAYFAAMLCPAQRVPFIYDMASAIPVELERHSVLGTKLAQSVMKGAERRVLRRAGRVICSQGLADRVREIAPDTPVTEWRFPIPEVNGKPGIARELRRSLGIRDDEYVVLYAGNFSRYQGLDLLLEGFEIAARRNARLTLVCVGAPDAEGAAGWHDRLPEDLRARARFLPRIPRREVPDYLEMADALVSLRPAGDNAPLKLFEYMASGRPILATRGRAHEPVLTPERAFLCECNAEDIAARLGDLVRDPARAARLGEKARRYAQRQYSRESFEQLLLDVYRDFEPVTLPWDTLPAPRPRPH